jgi:sensor histidine kinase regulating citrate/malate metabolism
MVVFDKALLKVMLDSILTNVERHGFDKRRNDANRVEITLDLERYEDKPYVVLRVANNGAPFRSGFTIDDYITRGRYSASSGRSGLGGYHVYQIVKGHKGFLCLDSNKIWNVIVEVLLPIDYVELDNLVEYEHECI